MQHTYPAAKLSRWDYDIEDMTPKFDAQFLVLEGRQCVGRGMDTYSWGRAPGQASVRILWHALVGKDPNREPQEYSWNIKGICGPIIFLTIL